MKIKEFLIVCMQKNSDATCVVLSMYIVYDMMIPIQEIYGLAYDKGEYKEADHDKLGRFECY